MFIRVDAAIDYELTYNAYPLEVFFPVSVGGEWTAGGFGPDNAPAIITHFSEPDIPILSVADDARANDLQVFPNPTVDYINIPLGDAVNGNVMLNVFDLSGREVMSQQLSTASGSTVRVDASTLNRGLHVFRLTYEDNTSTSFRVVVNK